jgi:ribonucleoside-diphosphate reductase beta chain
MKLTDNRAAFKPFSYGWAFDYWLMSEQSHWLHTEVEMIQDVNDWKQKLTDEEKYFLTQIFRFFTQGDCFHSETEILTDSGWKFFFDLTEGDKVAQVDDDEKVTFVRPSRIICNNFDGELIRLKADRVAVNHAVTPTHRVVYKYKGDWKESLAKDAKLYQGKKLAVSGNGAGGKNELTPIERVWIAFQADGNVKDGIDGSKLGFIPHRFKFKKKRKIERFRDIITKTDLRFHESVDGEYVEFYVESPVRMCKDFSWVKLDEISKHWAKEFCEELVEWDGHKPDSYNKHYYYSTNKKAMDVAHAVACLSGIASFVFQKTDERSELFSDCYTLSLDIDGDGAVDCQHVDMIPEAYSGKVYCVTVPTGKILIRANGKSVVSGNCDVASAYVTNYLPMFKAPEVRMMLSSFAAREALHIAAYSHLVETLGLPESTYNEFLQYKEMAEKHEYVQEVSSLDQSQIAKQIACFSAFTEGMQLFSSFIMLLNFPRHGKMKGMGQIISWSLLDESLHCEAMIQLFRSYIKENIQLWTDELKKEIYTVAETMVSLEDRFIDLAFSMGPMEQLSADDVKQYIRYIADRRLISLGLKGIFKVKKNPLPWVEEIINAPIHTSFFENRAISYSKGALTGSWGDVWV